MIEWIFMLLLVFALLSTLCCATIINKYPDDFRTAVNELIEDFDRRL